MFALQMDMGNNADAKKIKSNLPLIKNETSLKRSARIIWYQIQYIAELLDSNNLFAWDCISIGSDFDGNINPLPGILTAADFEPLSKELVGLAGKFLSSGILSMAENREVPAEELEDRYMFSNTLQLLKEFY
jgi:hypothetical protein